LSSTAYRTLRNAAALALAAIILLFAAWAEVEAAHDGPILASVDALGKQLSRADQTPAELGARAEMNGFRLDMTIVGNVDDLRRNSGGALHVVGWAWDAGGASRDLAALVFYGGQYQGAALTRVRRPDVLAALHRRLSLFLRPGFNIALGPFPCAPDGALVVLLATPDKRFKTLPPPTAMTGCAVASSAPDTG
jgi:hypothetical protein